MPPGEGDGGEILDAARELYALEPGGFTEARNRRAAQLKDDGGRRSAAVVRRLRKPATAAWLANTMVRELPEEIGQLLDLGAQLREATADLDADQIRALDRQRRGLVAALVSRGTGLVEGHGPRITQAVRDEVAATLHAAMADPAAADALRTGLLVRPMTSTGLGQTDLDGVLALSGTAPAGPGPGRTAGTRRRRTTDTGTTDADAAAPDGRDRAAGAEAAVRAAEAALEEARGHERAAARRQGRAADDLADAAETVEKLQARELQLRSELEELRRQVADHEHALDRNEARLARADAERGEAQERAGAAEDEAAAAQERLAEVERALRDARAAAEGTLRG